VGGVRIWTYKRGHAIWMHDPVTTRGTGMFFLIRMAFWFSLVLLALPLTVGSEESGHESVGPIQALLAAREAVGDIAGICERKPEVCETGRSAMQTIGARAKETARIATAMLDEKPAAGTPAPGTDVSTMTASLPEVTLPETVVLPETVDLPARN
jgi:hypothetical protein